MLAVYIVPGLLIAGDDWEHEETFTDDDEAVGNDPEEREDQAPELPAPSEIKEVAINSINILCWLIFAFTMMLHHLTSYL